MKQTIKESYKDEIQDILNNFPKEDFKIIEDYSIKRRTSASDEKCKQYQVKLVILRDIAQINFDKWNNPDIINNLLIVIKNSNRNDKIELRKILKHFLDWKFNNPRLTKLVKCGTQKPNREKINKSNFPTDKEIEKMFLACDSLQEKAMFCLQEELGLRPAEVLNLRWKDIKLIEDSNHAIIQVNGTKSINSVRTLPAKSSYIHLLRWRNEYTYSDRKPEDFVFPSGNRTKPHQRQYMDFLYTKLCKKAKIRNITPYMLRHRRLTFVFEKTSDLLLTSKFGGHSIKISSDYYQHSSDNDIKNMIMEKVYDVKELTPTEKNEIKELREENQELQTKFSLLKEDMENQIKQVLFELEKEKNIILNKVNN